MGPATNAINNLALALISVFGAILYLHGSISIGSISAFVLYSRKFTGPSGRSQRSTVSSSPPWRRQSGS